LEKYLTEEALEISFEKGMEKVMHGLQKSFPSSGIMQGIHARLLIAASFLCLSSGGCAALTNPVVDGAPVRRLPPELLFPRSRDAEVTIPLTLLGQPKPETYRLGPGDVLGLYIPGILGEQGQPLPAHYTDSPRLKSALGYPVTVRDDGTIALPLVEPINVQGKSIQESEETIRSTYVKKKLPQPGGEAERRILVTLQRQRTYRVFVLRQELGGFDSGPEGVAGIAIVGGAGIKRGTGHVVDLPAYENDVLNALTLSGGLPGLDAYDDVFIMRNPSLQDRATVEQELKKTATGHKPAVPAGLSCPVVRIPLRARPGEAPDLKPEDVVLQTGDVVFIEARDLDVFYTGGLLPPGEFVLPRDRDLDVVEAISLVKGPIVNGAFSVSSLSGLIIQPGIGSPSPSLLTVLRQMPGYGQIPIRVDLNLALRDRRERILVQPKDVLILQETPEEALVRYFDETFRFTFFYRVFGSLTSRGQGTINAVVP
jgi:hypothetical protein